MGSATRKNSKSTLERDSKPPGAFSTNPTISSSSAAPTTTKITPSPATISAGIPPATTPRQGTLSDSTATFQALPVELKTVVAEFLKEMGAEKSLRNLCLARREVRDCLIEQCYETSIWFHKGKQNKWQWWHGMKSPEMKAIRHLFVIVKPNMKTGSLKQRIYSEIHEINPRLKSFATWDRYDAVTGRWAPDPIFTVRILAPHRPIDFHHTAISLQCEPVQKKSDRLDVFVTGRVQEVNENQAARQFFPNKSYGLKNVRVSRVGFEVGMPVALLAQFGGALSFSEENTLLEICDFVEWDEKEKLINMLSDMIAINPRAVHTNLTFHVPCLSKFPSPIENEMFILECADAYFAAVASCSRQVKLVFRICDQDGNVNTARLWATGKKRNVVCTSITRQVGGN